MLGCPSARGHCNSKSIADWTENWSNTSGKDKEIGTIESMKIRPGDFEIRTFERGGKMAG
jgi:hypothetical protein